MVWKLVLVLYGPRDGGVAWKNVIGCKREIVDACTAGRVGDR